MKIQPVKNSDLKEITVHAWEGYCALYKDNSLYKVWHSRLPLFCNLSLCTFSDLIFKNSIYVKLYRDMNVEPSEIRPHNFMILILPGNCCKRCPLWPFLYFSLSNFLLRRYFLNLITGRTSLKTIQLLSQSKEVHCGCAGSPINHYHPFSALENYKVGFSSLLKLEERLGVRS